jgi:flagellar basal body rod protein FlgB
MNHADFPRRSNLPAVVRHEKGFAQRNDENNVSIEVEHALRDQNQLLYSAAVQLYSGRMGWLGHVLDARR